MTNSIEVINLSKKYKDKEAVANINFKIHENEMVGLLGPNGCGKTTTIGMILGLLKPSSGDVLINGVNNYTGTYFSKIVEGLEHDSVWRHLNGPLQSEQLIKHQNML